MIGTPIQLASYIITLDKEKKYEIKPYVEKRSINANNYAWQLMEQIGHILHTSKDEMYELMLQQYGTLLRDSNDDLIVIPIASELKSTATLHLKFIGKKEVNGNLLNMYAVIKGSSQYDTKEMARFIDGVVYEAKEVGVNTMTPNEILNLKNQWKEVR